MNRIRGLCLSGTTLMIVLAGAAPARAELYQDVARGLALLDFRFSGERNVLGDGITVNAGAVYNNREFDFGVAELTLTGQLGLSAGFTRRGIPGAEFSMSTGGTPLAYTFEINNGIQDLTANGRALIDISTDINALGFYDQTIQISNRGTFETDGFGPEDTGTLAFDVGPIDISGNIFADVLAAVTEPFFAANGVENPFAKFSDRATRLLEATKSIEELQARAAAGEYLTDAELSSLINNSIIAAVLGGKPSAHVLDDLLLSGSEDTVIAARIVTVPEPVAMTALLLPLAVCLRGRRRGS